MGKAMDRLTGIDSAAALAILTANVQATERLATAIDRLAAATEQSNAGGEGRG